MQVFHELKKEDDIFKAFVTKEIENFKIQGKRTALLVGDEQPRRGKGRKAKMDSAAVERVLPPSDALKLGTVNN